MRHLDLFSGIGGFALAAKWAGFETVGFCEQDDFCKLVLSARWPGVPIHNDVRELDGRLFRGVELISGGYPCQPFSTAGHRKGVNDERFLWPEMLRIIEQVGPRFVIAENVAGHISNGLDSVLCDLENANYTARPVVVPAGAVGARQRRERVWILAHATGYGWGKREQNERGCVARNAEREEQRPGHVFSHIWERPLESLFCGSAHGIPRRVDRLRALGNAIVPQVAYELLRVMTHNA